jgi:hypothetical protein
MENTQTITQNIPPVLGQNIPIGELTPLASNEPAYEVHVYSKAGHDTLKLGLDATVDRIFNYFNVNKMWAVINDTVFKTAAVFNGTDSDNAQIEKDKLRLRTMLSNLTTVDVAIPGNFIVPQVQVVPRLRGGKIIVNLLS